MGAVRGGLARLSVYGQTFDAKTDMDCTLGGVKREPIVGVDGTHGFKETVEPAKVSGTITVGPDTDVQALVDTTDATVIVEFRSGKKFALYHACYAGDRKVSTGECEMQFEFVAAKGEYI